MNFRNTLFALICLCGQRFYGKPVAWGQVKTMTKLCMLPCHNLWDLEKQRGRGFLNLLYGRKGKSHKQEKLLWDAIKKNYLLKELTTELLYLELPIISASCGVKRYMHYIRFLLTKTS